MENFVKVNNQQLVKEITNLQQAIETFIETYSKSEQLDVNDKSKQNLSAFLALREYEHAGLNNMLVAEGLTPIGVMTPHISYSLEKVLQHLVSDVDGGANVITAREAKKLHEERRKHLFGKEKRDSAAIKVTLDGRMLETPKLFEKLLGAGMSIARINLARDPFVWRELIAAVRRAEAVRNTAETCQIYVDLPGPKIRVTDFSTDKDDTPVEVRVSVGDIVRIYRSQDFYGTAKRGEEPASLGITLPEAIREVKLHDKVYFDDGKIAGVVVAVTEEYVEVEIRLTRKNEEKISAQKGINFPNSNVGEQVEAVGETDIQLLQEVQAEVDLIGVSFVHHAEDLRVLKGRLNPNKEIGIIAKIETAKAVENLPEIIMEGLNFPSFGVMIARGDLALEVGYDKLAEAQELILDMCEAAHVPVIWATGVLDQMNRNNIPLRSELTDVYMGLRADCVMLNKGSNVVGTVEFLRKMWERR